MSVLVDESVFNLKFDIAERGCVITVRQVTTEQGPTPAPNPPTLKGVQVASAQVQDDTSIVFSGSQLTGRFVAGDKFTLPGDTNTYTITVGATASGNSIGPVTFTPGLAENVASGVVPASFIFAADTTLSALVTSMPTRLVNGTTILAEDMAVRFLASSLSTAPLAGATKVFIGSDQYSCVAVKKVQLSGQVYAYFCQVRR